MNISWYAAGPRHWDAPCVAEDDFITSPASSDLAGVSKTPECGARRRESRLTSGQRRPAGRGEAACRGRRCWKGEIYRGVQSAQRSACWIITGSRWRQKTRRGRGGEEGRQMASVKKSSKHWRVEIRWFHFIDALLLILSGTLSRGCYFHAANRATNSGSDSINWRKSSRIPWSIFCFFCITDAQGNFIDCSVEAKTWLSLSFYCLQIGLFFVLSIDIVQICLESFFFSLLSLSQLIVHIFCIVHYKQKIKNYAIHLFITWEYCVSAANEVMNMHKTFGYVECVWISISMADVE